MEAQLGALDEGKTVLACSDQEPCCIISRSTGTLAFV